MNLGRILKILIPAAIVVAIIGVYLANAWSSPPPPIQVYVPWRDETSAIFKNITLGYKSVRANANVSVIWPATAQVDARALVFAKIVEEYIKPLVIRREASPSIVFVTICGRELASYLYSAVWGVDDFTKFDDLAKKGQDPAILACSLTGYLKEIDQSVSNVFVAPIMVYQANLIYINSRVLNRLNLSIPKTLDDLLNACSIASKSDVACLALPGYDPRAYNAYDIGPMILWDNILLAVGGSENYAKVYYGDVSVTDPIINKSITVLMNVTRYVNPDWRRTTRDSAIDMLVKGNALFYVGGSWDLRVITSRYPNISVCPETSISSDCDIIVTQFPGTQGVFSMVVYGMGVVNNPSSGAGVDLVKYMLREDTQKVLVQKLFAVSPYLSEDQYQNPVLKWITTNYRRATGRVVSIAVGGTFYISGADFTGAIYGIIGNVVDYYNKRAPRIDISSQITTIRNYFTAHRDRWRSMNLVLGLRNNYLFSYTPTWLST
jgi:hypothetical protein